MSKFSEEPFSIQYEPDRDSPPSVFAGREPGVSQGWIYVRRGDEMVALAAEATVLIGEDGEYQIIGGQPLGELRIVDSGDED